MVTNLGVSISLIPSLDLALVPLCQERNNWCWGWPIHHRHRYWIIKDISSIDICFILNLTHQTALGYLHWYFNYNLHQSLHCYTHQSPGSPALELQYYCCNSHAIDSYLIELLGIATLIIEINFNYCRGPGHIDYLLAGSTDNQLFIHHYIDLLELLQAILYFELICKTCNQNRQQQ